DRQPELEELSRLICGSLNRLRDDGGESLAMRPLQLVVAVDHECEVILVSPLELVGQLQLVHGVAYPVLRNDRGCCLKQRIEASVLVTHRYLPAVEANQIALLY